VDHSVGLTDIARTGQAVRAGDELAVVHAASRSMAEAVRDRVLAAAVIDSESGEDGASGEALPVVLRSCEY
jgi:thymidine phosphorylase